LGEYKEKDNVKQLFVRGDGDSVIELSKIWNYFKDQLEAKAIRDAPEVFQELIRFGSN
jgi:hypothetical protein